MLQTNRILGIARAASSKKMVRIPLAAVSVVAVVALCGPFAIADDRITTTFDARIVPSGALKAYKGPEGEVIVMVEINDGKEILVHFRNLGPDLEGKTWRYLYEDRGDGNKDVFLEGKRGSKAYRKMLLAARDNRWEFYHPNRPTVHFDIHYSEPTSEKFKIEDVIKAIKP